MSILTSLLVAARGLRRRLPFGATLHKILREPYYTVIEALSPRGVKARLSDGQNVRLHPRMMGIRPEDYEQDLVARLGSLIKPGALVIDIGAHVGLQSLMFAHAVGPHGSVISVEPSPASAGLLRSHLAWNKCSNVKVIEAAVSDTAGSTEFAFRTEATDWGGFANSLAYDVGGDKVVVTLTTIDVICAGHDPALIKIDVEGAELLALRGAVETLERVHPKLIVAIHPEPMRAMDTSPRELVEFMEARGYVGVDLNGARITDPGFEEVIFTWAETGRGTA